ncbi:hypothetical protein NQ176_g8738 [Zarea fungicola]|uniref:Uncharacterized protein n=1 Tax=Zarea fungicola TaxID=93591 RepID=A0ACC1MQL6_9HYPO|nr:hypothetical protein NQ176_g8738 [Lecanicillium fungicola]
MASPSTTTEAAASMTTIQSVDGRTSIIMYGQSHEDPLRHHPVTRSRAGVRKSVQDMAIGADEKSKRTGLVLVEETAGSSREDVGTADDRPLPMEMDDEEAVVKESESGEGAADNSRQSTLDTETSTVNKTPSEVAETGEQRPLPS